MRCWKRPRIEKARKYKKYFKNISEKRSRRMTIGDREPAKRSRIVLPRAVERHRNYQIHGHGADRPCGRCGNASPRSRKQTAQADTHCLQDRFFLMDSAKGVSEVMSWRTFAAPCVAETPEQSLFLPEDAPSLRRETMPA